MVDPLSTQLMQRFNPRHHVARASARAESVAGPQDLLGAQPHRGQAWLSELARALSAAEAAQLRAPLSAATPAPGSRFDQRA